VPITEVVKIGRGITFPLGILSTYNRNADNHDTNLIFFLEIREGDVKSTNLSPKIMPLTGCNLY
jgi:hypothetical protein